MIEPKVDSGDARPRRSTGRTLVGLLVGAATIAVLVGQLTDPDPLKRPLTAVVTTATPDLTATPEPDKPIGVESIVRCVVNIGGLALGDRHQAPAPAVDRWDCDAYPKGPWSVVIRATGGHFGVHGAVVTFPVDDERGGTPVAKPRGARSSPGTQELVWPLAGSHARIVGDVGQTQLAYLAMRVTVENGRPHLAALDGFATRAATYRAPVVHEMRYGAIDLGQKSIFGDGLVFTGVTQAASFESLAFESHAKPAGFVRGQPAVYSDALGGSGTLAWESAPGEVTYIGHSSVASSADAIEALRALADRGRLLTPAQWQAKDRMPVAAPSG